MASRYTGWPPINVPPNPRTFSDPSAKTVDDDCNPMSGKPKQPTVSDRLKWDGRFNFTLEETKKTILWMVRNKAIRATGHAKEHEVLMTDLGFNDASLTGAAKSILKAKVAVKMRALQESLESKGALKVQPGKKRGEFEVKFADWTCAWLEEDWDGVIASPICYAVDKIEEEDLDPEVFVVEEPTRVWETLPFEVDSEVLDGRFMKMLREIFPLEAWLWAEEESEVEAIAL